MAVTDTERPRSDRPIGLGCMRLSTERDRDEARAIAVLHAALDAGVTFLDTADAYCWTDEETGHNERLIARALATWTGDRSRVVVATKGGLMRPQGNWIPNGRARHLVSACEASRRTLGVDRIDLYQLHVPDPRTPLATSVRALATLQRDGLVNRIGLCNVTVGQIEEARQIVDVDAVQIELSVWNDDHLLSGVVEYCIRNGIRVIAYRPFGGAKRARRIASDRLLIEVAARHGPYTTPFEIALAWILDLSDLIVPIPGPTRVENATAIAKAYAIRLTDEDRAQLDARFTSGALLRDRLARGEASPPPESVAPEAHVADADREIVLIMGLPGAGKSTLARSFVAQGYTRINRDEDGGTLRELVPVVDRLLASGHSRLVLDNTYVSRKSRAPVLHAAARAGLPVRCVWLSTSVEDAQVNAVRRMVSKFGRLLTPEEMKQTTRHDVSAFGPGVQFRYQRDLEPPQPDEGFARIETIPFARTLDPSFTNRALIVWCDGVLTEGRSRADSDASAASLEPLLDQRAAVLQRYAAEGWLVLGIGWQPSIAEQTSTVEDVDGIYARMRERLGVAMEVRYCPHGAGPPICWCRKPLPGLGVVFVERHRLDPARCLYVGPGPQDPGFARKLGFPYREAADFFRSPAVSA